MARLFNSGSLIAFFSLTLLIFFGKSSSKLQKISLIGFALLNSAILWFAINSLHFHYIMLLVGALLLAELILIADHKFVATVLISSSLILSTMLIGHLFYFSFKSLKIFEWEKWDDAKVFLVFVSISFACILYAVFRFTKVHFAYQNLLKSSTSLEFLTTCIMFLISLVLFLYLKITQVENIMSQNGLNVDVWETLVPILSILIAALYIYFLKYSFDTCEIDETIAKAYILEKQLEKQLLSHKIYGEYLEEMGVLRHDFKGYAQTVTLSLNSGEDITAHKVIDDVENIFKKASVQKQLSNNVGADSALKDMELFCKDNDIKYRAQLYIPSNFPLSDLKLFQAISSLTDIAKKHCMDCGDTKPFFSVQSAIKTSWISIVIEFSYSGKPWNSQIFMDSSKEFALNLFEIQEMLETAEGVVLFDADEEKHVLSMKIHFRK